MQRLEFVHYDAPARIAATGQLPEHKVAAVGGNVTLTWEVVPLVTLKAAYYHDKGTDLNGVAGRFE